MLKNELKDIVLQDFHKIKTETCNLQFILNFLIATIIKIFMLIYYY